MRESTHTVSLWVLLQAHTQSFLVRTVANTRTVSPCESCCKSTHRLSCESCYKHTHFVRTATSSWRELQQTYTQSLLVRSVASTHTDSFARAVGSTHTLWELLKNIQFVIQAAQSKLSHEEPHCVGSRKRNLLCANSHPRNILAVVLAQRNFAWEPACVRFHKNHLLVWTLTQGASSWEQRAPLCGSSHRESPCAHFYICEILW